MKKFAWSVAALLATSPAANAQATLATQTFDVNGLSLEYATVAAVALPIKTKGARVLTVHVDAAANGAAMCVNPDGVAPPGLNPVETSTPVTVSGTEMINLLPGVANVDVFVRTNPPPATIPGAPDCPNENFSERITGLDFTSAVVTMTEIPGGGVLQETCTFNRPLAPGGTPQSCH